MQYIAFVFAIFGFFAYLELGKLKNRVADLERELTKKEGSSYHESRKELLEAARTYIGEKVELDLKEDQMDIDVVNYGNTKHGTNTVVDVDDDWLLVRIDTPKGTKEKLLRLESVERITVLKD